jgi:PD-(D/E)XK nuclease superfamily
MARPKLGYKNAAGLPVPATGDINGRFMDRTRMLFWAFKRGKEGHKQLYDNSVLDIGTCVHTMAELDLRDRSQEDIDFYANTTLPDPDERAKAATSFKAFRAWRAEFHVRAHAQEVSLVSERLQFGGTLDTIAVVRNGLALLEFKTSSDVYEDHLMQMAAYGILWEETHPNEILTAGYHLILLPKDGAKNVHREYTRDQLKPYRKKFKLYRKAYDLDGYCNSAAALKGGAVEASPKPAVAPKVVVAKPRVRIESRSAPMSIGEMLRSYGHIKEGVPA